MQAFLERNVEYDKSLDIRPRVSNFCQPHFHSHVETVYVEDGEMEVTVNGETRLLTHGWASIANSYDVHTYQTPRYSDARILVIPLDMIGQFGAFMQNKCFASPFLPPGPHISDLETVINKLDFYHRTDNTMLVTGYLYVLLGIFIQQIGIKPLSKGGGMPSLTRNILLYIDNHYLEPLTLDDIARQCGYNKCYISRFFNSVLGCGFNRYINTLRVRHAASLMRESDAGIEEIAARSGFQNIRNFNRYFQLLYQTTPKEYKRSLRKG